MSEQKKKNNVVVLVIIIVLVATIGGYAVFDTQNKNKSTAEITTTMQETTTAVKSTETTTTTQVTTTEATTNQLLEIKSAYEGVLDSFTANEYDEYFLYDIDKNEVPELIIKSGTCEADYMFYYYTYDNKLINLGSDSAGHSYLGIPYDSDEPKLIKSQAHQGHQVVSEITVESGRIKKTYLFEKDVMETEDYAQYDVLSGTSITDMSAINNIK